MSSLSGLPLRKKIEFNIAVTFGWVIIFLLGKTVKLKCDGLHHLLELENQGLPYLISAWHGRLLMPLFRFRHKKLIVLVSQHLDGEMIARSLHRLGYRTIRGSSTRGGSKAVQEMVKTMKNGNSAVIIPDGPTGPRHQLKMGVVYMAMVAGVPIIPMTFSANSAYVLNSWDRFLVPKPFSSVLIKIGSPIEIPKKCSNRELVVWTRKVQQKMVDQELAADAFFAA
ncbi:lysophospholipid acyltransferase family protein [candidate division KSB1 bacterium]|nr:lysophospholipid acyltransferase family protein [candidate division KSB1 bacterium]